MVGLERTDDRLAHTALRRSYSTALFGSWGFVDGIGDGSSTSFSGSDSLSSADELSSVADSVEASDEAEPCVEMAVAAGRGPGCFRAVTFSFFTRCSRSGGQGPSPFSSSHINNHQIGFRKVAYQFERASSAHCEIFSAYIVEYSLISR